MPDLMTSHGRAVMLRQIEPHLRDFEKGMERRAVTVMNAVRDMERPTWIKVGGGLLVVATLAAAFNFLMRPSAQQEEAQRDSRPAHRRASRPSAKRMPAKPAPTGRGRSNGRAHA